MIVPLSLGFSADFVTCREMLFSQYAQNWFLSFGRIPSALFSFDVRVRNTIHLGYRASRTAQACYTTRLHRWFDIERPNLFQLVRFARFSSAAWDGRVPKADSTSLVSAIELLSTTCKTVAQEFSVGLQENALHYRSTAYNWLNFCYVQPPCLDKSGNEIGQSQFSTQGFNSAAVRDTLFLLLNGKLGFLYWCIVGDDFHVAKWMFSQIPTCLSALSSEDKARLNGIVPILWEAMQRATVFKANAGKLVGNYNVAKCRDITDKSDQIFAKSMGLESIWEEVELLYSRMVRTDFEGDEE